MKTFNMLEIDLRLFDGGTASAGGEGTGATAAGQVDDSTKGGTQAVPGRTRRGKPGGFEHVKFGKQGNDPAAEAQTGTTPDAGEDKTKDVKDTSKQTLEEKRKAYRELVSGDYKDIYTEDIQRLINRRFAEQKALEEKLSNSQPVLEMLMDRYNIKDGDVAKLQAAIESDDMMWGQAAEEAGMSVEQYRQFKALERANAQFRHREQVQQREQMVHQQTQRWLEEAEQVRETYPDFDFQTEMQNPQFLSLLKSGIPVQHAYEVSHLDDIKHGVAQYTAAQTEKQVVDTIRSKGARPPENGTASQSAFTVKDDVSKLSKQERAEIARRSLRGELISF